MRHAAFLAQALATPWAMQREVLSAYAGILARKFGGAQASQKSAPAPPADKMQAASGNIRRAGGGSIAVIPLMGTIMQRASLMDMCEGATSLQQFGSDFRQAMADETVGQILIEIDSPGGSVYGVAEMFDEVYAARAIKPVVAIANSLAASAAYWLGCASSELYVTPGGEVGSIGVWQAHEDWSQALEEAGVKTTLISAGKYKVEGNPFEPLTDDATAFLQSRVQDYYTAFTKGVARGRGVPVSSASNGMGQGRVLGADAALAEKMVDGIDTLDGVIKRMQRSQKSTKQAKSGSLQDARNRLALASVD